MKIQWNMVQQFNSKCRKACFEDLENGDTFEAISSNSVASHEYMVVYMYVTDKPIKMASDLSNGLITMFDDDHVVFPTRIIADRIYMRKKNEYY